MRVVIRADASLQMGSGHVVRCLTLAENLRDRKASVSFLSQSLPGHLHGRIEARGFPVHGLPALEVHSLETGRDWSVPHSKWLGVDWRHDAGHAAAALAAVRPEPDWLIVDHYALDGRWESAMRRHARRILAVDDLANRPHDCDLLLDQIFTEDRHRYRDLLPARCRKLTGSQYVLLRPEFAAARARADFPRQFLDNNLAHVFFGTSDANGYTIRFSRLLLEHFPGLRLKIAVGDSFVHLERLVELADRFRERAAWEKGVTDMAGHMQGCSIAVGTPGMSTWERACMGLPAAHVTNSDSQVATLLALKKSGFCEWLGYAETITDDAFVAGMRVFLDDKAKLAKMRETGLANIDGKGTERVVAELMGQPS